MPIVEENGGPKAQIYGERDIYLSPLFLRLLHRSNGWDSLEKANKMHFASQVVLIV